MIGRDIPAPGGGRLATIRSPEPEDLPDPADDSLDIAIDGTAATHDAREHAARDDAETPSTPDTDDDPGRPGDEPS